MVKLLPTDLLRQVLEAVARSHSQTAVTLSLVCKTVHIWINEIIYRNVNLKNQRSARAFLRTVLHADSDFRRFMAGNVKSLFVYSDIEPGNILVILGACRGVKSLSYWPTSSPLRTIMSGGSAWDDFIPRMNRFLTDKERSGLVAVDCVTRSFDLHNLSHVYPERLSILLHEFHPIPIFRPSMGSMFFANVTHLSILNRWEDWTCWAPGEMTLGNLPRLKYLKFDFIVGESPPVNNASPHLSWLRIVTNADSEAGMDVDHQVPTMSFSTEALCRWELKLNRVASAVSGVLNHHEGLDVCVLILRSNKDPSQTARHISRLAASNLDSKKNHTYTYPMNTSTGFDRRLVFAWEKQPFRYGYAHSSYEERIWKSAQAVASAQRFLSGYTMMDCDRLI